VPAAKDPTGLSWWLLDVDHGEAVPLPALPAL